MQKPSRNQKTWKSKIKEYLLAKYPISKKEAELLSEDFSLLLCILHKDIVEYPRLAARKKISISTMFHSLLICCKCSLSEEESKPISTGLLLADHNAVIQVLPNNIEIPLPKRLRIQNWRKIRKLCGYVDGETAIFVVEKSNGSIKGAKNLPNSFTVNQHIYSHITHKIKDSVAFLVVKGCKCFRVYADGMIAHQVILLRKYGEWTNRNFGFLLRELKSIASSKTIKTIAIQRMLQAALLISEHGEGAQLLVVDRKRIQSKIRKETLLRPPKKIEEMTVEKLIRNVTEDGASIFNNSGELQSVEAKFAAIGGRVGSMMDITKLAPKGMAIVISVDSAISLIDNGKVIREF